MVLVTEVPMLEPMMMGMAELTSSTGRRGDLLTNWEEATQLLAPHFLPDPLSTSQPPAGTPAMLLIRTSLRATGTMGTCCAFTGMYTYVNQCTCTAHAHM